MFFQAAWETQHFHLISLLLELIRTQEQWLSIQPFARFSHLFNPETRCTLLSEACRSSFRDSGEIALQILRMKFTTKEYINHICGSGASALWNAREKPCLWSSLLSAGAS